MKISLLFLVSFVLCLFGVDCALLGVDFGTEYSKAILVAPGVPFDILLTSESKRKDVSGLAIDFDTKKDKVQVNRKFGTHALSTCIKSPSSCLLYLKPLLGIESHSEHVENYNSKFPGIVLSKQADRDAIDIILNSKDGKHEETFNVEEAIAMSFLEIKNRALDYWKERSPETVGIIDEVVISVPRYFNEASRIALIDAAEIAGLKVISLVDDGLAIALDYAQKKSDIKTNTKEYHLVFDSGAGSTKASLVSISNLNETINVEIENYAYDNTFNGQLFTLAVKNILLKQFSEKENISINELKKDAKIMHKLWQVSEKTKLILSANTETNVNIESFYNDIDFKGYITRSELENEIQTTLKSIPTMLDIVFEGFDKSNLKSVILSGGSVRVPIIQETLIEYFGGNENILSKNVNADESVVFGTTLRGAQIMKLTRRKQINVIDHSPYEYSINYKSAQIDGTIDVLGGMISNEKVNVNLTEFENKFLQEIQIDLIENNNNQKTLTHKFNFAMPKKFNDTSCDGGISYTLNYGYSKFDIFIINSIKVNCYQMINGTVSEIPKTTKMQSTSEFLGFKPLSLANKKKSIAKLDSYEKMDLALRHVSDTKNQLEATLYEIRYILEELEEILPSDLYDGISTNVSEFLEWLDYDSDDAEVTEILTKLDVAKDMKLNTKKYDLIVTLESAIQNIKLPYDLLLEKRDSVIKNIDLIKEKESVIFEECSKYDLDCEKLLKKLYGSEYPKTELVMQRVNGWLESVGEHAQSLISVDTEATFKKLSSSLLVEALNIIEKVESELSKIGEAFHTIYENRTDFLTQQIATVRKAAKKAEREKAKVEKENAEKEKTDAENLKTETEEVEKEAEVEQTTANEEKTVDHDEL